MDIPYYIVPDNIISTIDSDELQRLLRKYPDCVLIFGSAKDFQARFEEMGIKRCVGRSIFKFSSSDLFNRLFFMMEFRLFNIRFLRIAKSNVMMFDHYIDEDILTQEMLRSIQHQRVAYDAQRRKQESTSPADEMINPRYLPVTLWETMRLLFDPSRDGSITLVMKDSKRDVEKATRHAYWAITQVLSSEKDGIGLKDGVSFVNFVNVTGKEVRFTLKVRGIRNNGLLFYCNESIETPGPAGGTWRCGPSSGVHCAECDAKQRRCADSVDINVHISTTIEDGYRLTRIAFVTCFRDEGNRVDAHGEPLPR